jgi:hypothetical protein
MMSVQGLLVLQGATSDPAIPAKVYEYLRAGKPLVGLVNDSGETARLLSSVGIERHAGLQDRSTITRLLRHWLTEPDHLRPHPESAAMIKSFSRKQLTGNLAKTLDQIVVQNGG